MQQYQYKNKKGQEVGFVKNNIYYTKRNVKLEEIFKIKKYFDGKKIDNAVAIDKWILEDLYEKKVEFIEMTIIGIETNSFIKKIPVEAIMLKGITQNFDKDDIHGWNEQVVFSYDWEKYQKTLNEV